MDKEIGYFPNPFIQQCLTLQVSSAKICPSPFTRQQRISLERTVPANLTNRVLSSPPTRCMAHNSDCKLCNSSTDFVYRAIVNSYLNVDPDYKAS